MARAKPRTDDWKTQHWPYTMPSPDAREGGESTWELWRREAQRFDLAFAPTQPTEAVPLAGSAAAAAPDLSGGKALTVHSLVAAARHHNRVCPQAEHWAALYRLLEGQRCDDLRPPPVRPELWAALSPLQKRLRFREFIEWAGRHWRLQKMAQFLGGLAEADWVHMGEE